MFTLKVRISKKNNIIYSGIPENHSVHDVNACFEETKHYNKLTQKWSVFEVAISYFDYYDDGNRIPHYYFTIKNKTEKKIVKCQRNL